MTMYRIRKISFIQHPILGDLSLDFCGQDDLAVDTVIFAGENGTGKSTILNELYKVAAFSISSPLTLEYENDGIISTVAYTLRHNADGTAMTYLSINGEAGIFIGSSITKARLPFRGIFSDVDINFHAHDISTVTSLSLDSRKDSRRSSTNLPTEIKQLLIDIQALDDADIARAVEAHPEIPGKALEVTRRMPRFTDAFNRMLDGLTYSRIINQGGAKSILFQKKGVPIPIDGLSSGEKQIVYRGCFLLRDVNAINGAFAFIDEPEISLHPNWQKKVLDYYKGIFTGTDGQQTSQLFVVTHSPFVIHNENRKNDKVIVLARDKDGRIVVKDKPDYYKCTSIEAVEDAFQITDFSKDTPTVYLEGRTDEKYFNKALEVFGISAPFVFKWVGHLDRNGQEANTGKDALNKAILFLAGRQLTTKNVCLFDCDTNKPRSELNNVVTMCLPKYENAKGISIGIENALEFGDINIDNYKKQKVEIDGYGIEKRIPDFQKMACCEYICTLDGERLKSVFVHLKEMIDELTLVFSS